MAGYPRTVKNETELDVNRNMIGKRYRVLATEVGKEGTITRTGNYRPVVIRDKVELGTFLDVEVDDCESTYLLGHTLG